MKNSTELIVLNYTKFGENSIVVHTLSRAYGRRSFLIRVGKKASMSLFQPLSLLEADIVENPRATLWNAVSPGIRHPLGGLRSNLSKNAMAVFMSEVLYRVVRDGERDDALFDWCDRQILTLDALESDFSNFHLLFLLGLAGALGFSPTAEELMPFARNHPQEIRRLVEAETGEALLLPLTGPVRCGICEDILRYLEFHTDARIEVRSLDILRELFA